MYGLLKMNNLVGGSKLFYLLSNVSIDVLIMLVFNVLDLNKFCTELGWVKPGGEWEEWDWGRFMNKTRRPRTGRSHVD